MKKNQDVIGKDTKLDNFKNSDIGQACRKVFEDQALLREARKLLAQDKQPLLAFSKAPLALPASVNIHQKQARCMFGQWAREIAGRWGWTPDRSKAMPKGNLFGHATVYKLRD